MATIASVDELFASVPKRRHKTVKLPISGHSVRIQSLTEKDFADYQACFLDKQGRRVPARLAKANRIFISICVVDDAGNRLITGENVDRIADWDAADTNYLYSECAAHAGISTEDIEELVKNSSETQES